VTQPLKVISKLFNKTIENSIVMECICKELNQGSVHASSPEWVHTP